jgi:hypothetical protein
VKAGPMHSRHGMAVHGFLLCRLVSTRDDWSKRVSVWFLTIRDVSVPSISGIRFSPPPSSERAGFEPSVRVTRAMVLRFACGSNPVRLGAQLLSLSPVEFVDAPTFHLRVEHFARDRGSHAEQLLVP